MAKTVKVSVDPKAVKNAEDLWHNFTKFMTYSVIGTAAVLVALAAVFVEW